MSGKADHGMSHGFPANPEASVLGKRMESTSGIPASEVRQRIKLQDRLTLPGPADAATGLKRGDDIDGARILVPVMQVQTYDRNPRRTINPKFDEIKESIRAVGLLTPFNITRRPGEAHFIVCGGGNTRLVILQQLFQEGYAQFERVELTFKAWRGDADAIAGHIGENDQRGEMCFWDRAVGVMDIKVALEAASEDPGNPLSLRQFEAELKRLGLSVALANISLMKFALEWLAPLGQRLTGLDVKRIQPRLNLLKRLAGLWQMDEAGFHEAIVNPALHEHVLRLVPDSGADAENLMRRWEASLAERIGVDKPKFAKMLAALDKAPSAQRSDLESLDAAAKPSVGHTTTAPTIQQVAEPIQHESGHEIGVSPETPLTPSPAPNDLELRQHLRQHLLEAAERLARAGGVAGWFAPFEALPLGYYMEAAPLPQDEDMEIRRTLWWLLAAASGQLDTDLAQRLPESSRWRRVTLREGGMDDSAFPFMVEDDLLAHVTQDGQAVLEPWSMLILLQDELLAGHCLELARLGAMARSADRITYRHLAEAIHRKEGR
jgi:ParB family protein of integrating conjugative element (PFGI_1 class)